MVNMGIYSEYMNYQYGQSFGIIPIIEIKTEISTEQQIIFTSTIGILYAYDKHTPIALRKKLNPLHFHGAFSDLTY